jgi:hypothetical protein
MYSTVEDLLKFDNAISPTSYFRHNRIDDLPKKHLIMLLWIWYVDGYGIFNSKFVYRPGGTWFDLQWIHMLDNKKKYYRIQYRCNLYEMSEQLYLISTGKKNYYPKFKK